MLGPFDPALVSFVSTQANTNGHISYNTTHLWKYIVASEKLRYYDTVCYVANCCYSCYHAKILQILSYI